MGWIGRITGLGGLLCRAFPSKLCWLSKWLFWGLNSSALVKWVSVVTDVGSFCVVRGETEMGIGSQGFSRFFSMYIIRFVD